MQSPRDYIYWDYLIGVYLNDVHLMGVYLMGVHLMGVSLIGCTSLGMHPMDVHLMGVVCVEAFRIFNLVFGKKSLYPTVPRALPDFDAMRTSSFKCYTGMCCISIPPRSSQSPSWEG
jgi:hypothetical protein